MSASASQIENAVLAVLKSTPEAEIGLVTMPVLRGRVARHLSVSEDVLQDKAAKTVILEAFQKFLLHGSSQMEAPDVSNVSSSDDNDEELVDSGNVPPKKKRRSKSSDDSKPKPSKTSSSKKTLSKDKAASSPAKGKTAASKTKTAPSTSEGQIERLKSYIFKCGVRKVWKKELEGLNGKQSIERLQTILTELGMAGRPTLEKCKEIRKRREFEAEMREIDMSNVIEGKRRNRSQARMVVEDSDDEEDGDGDDSDSEAVNSKGNASRSRLIDLRALGDPEESE